MHTHNFHMLPLFPHPHFQNASGYLVCMSSVLCLILATQLIPISQPPLYFTCQIRVLESQTINQSPTYCPCFLLLVLLVIKQTQKTKLTKIIRSSSST